MPPYALGGLASGLISGIFGAYQMHKARELAKNNPFPNQTIPQSILDNQRIAQLYGNVGLPQQQYNQAQQNIQRQENKAISSATDRRGGLAALPYIQQNANDANLSLDVADANKRDANRAILMNQNNILGNWQDKVWDWNKRQKYIQTAASARALMGAGQTNLFGGVDRTLGGGLGLIGNKGNGYGRGYSSDYSGNGQPSYYNGYDQNSQYGDFQTEYPQ